MGLVILGNPNPDKPLDNPSLHLTFRGMFQLILSITGGGNILLFGNSPIVDQDVNSGFKGVLKSGVLVNNGFTEEPGRRPRLTALKDDLEGSRTARTVEAYRDHASIQGVMLT